MAAVNPKIPFKTDEFNKAITSYGYKLTYEAAVLCPCLNIDTGQPDMNCNICQNGWTYESPAKIEGIMTSLSDKREFMEGGEWLFGDAQLTTTAEIRLSYHDRITNLYSFIGYSQFLVRKSDIIETRYPILDSYQKGQKTLSLPVIVITIKDSEKVTYQKGIDFVIEEGNLTWLQSRGPDGGDRFSIRYFCHSVWLVLEPVNLFRNTQVKNKIEYMPVRALMRLEYHYDR